MYCLGQAILNLRCVGEERSPFLFGFWQEKTNEDSQMVAGGSSTVGTRCAWRQWETQQGGIQVAALSTSCEIQTQGIDCRLFYFACRNKRTLFLFQNCEPITVARYLPQVTLLSLLFSYLLKQTQTLCGECLFKDCIRLAWGKDEVEPWVKWGCSHISLMKRNLGLS